MEVVLQGSILNRYLDKKSNQTLYEDFLCSRCRLASAIRHIRHNEVGSKNRNEEQIFLFTVYKRHSVQAVGPLSH